MSSVPKAVLYYSKESVWSYVALITLEEKGYGNDEIDRRMVDLGKGENYSPSFLRLNPKGILPTLVVPYQDTLLQDSESRYKALTTIKDIVDFLDKSRSANSRTNTTSTAPAPALAPATISFALTSNKLIEDISHSEEGSPEMLLYLNARNDTSLKDLAKEVFASLSGSQVALQGYISDAESGAVHISEKVKKFWQEKKGAIELLLDVFKSADKGTAELTAGEKERREAYFAIANTAWEVALKGTLLNINQEITGPYALGEQLSIADLHLSPWITRLVKLSGGTPSMEGNAAIARIEAHIGNGFALPKDFVIPEGQRKEGATATPQSKLAAFWDAVKERESWKKLYGEGLC